MKTKYIAKALIIGLITLFPWGTSIAQDIEAGINEALNRAVTLPLPNALDPILTVAQELDVIALSTANGLIVRKIEEILHEEIDAGNDRTKIIKARRRMRAARRLQSKFSTLKRQKEIKERKAKEDGWDPFFAVFKANDTFNIQGSNTFNLFNNGEEANKAFSSIIRPVFGGDIDEMVNVSNGSFSANLIPTTNPIIKEIELDNFEMELVPFNISDTHSTGINKLKIFRENTNGFGAINISNGSFNFKFEGTITNDLYNDQNPIIFFANAIGVLNPANGELTISADDPMLVPLPPGLQVLQQPSWGAGVSTSFNATNGLLSFNNCILPNEKPHISLIRYKDGTYNLHKNVDPAVGAKLNIHPMLYDSEVASREFRFKKTTVTITNATGILLEGELDNILLNGNTGEFFGSLTIQNSNATNSKFISELSETTQPMTVQLSTGVGAYDLVELTKSFTISQEIPTIDLSHGTGEIASVQKKLRPITIILFAILIIIGIATIIRRRKT